LVLVSEECLFLQFVELTDISLGIDNTPVRVCVTKPVVKKVSNRNHWGRRVTCRRLSVTFLKLVHRMVGAPVQIPTQIVEIDCQHVWKELTNYIEGDLTPEMRDRIAHHLQRCRHCTAIYDGTRNVLQLLGDKQSIELPKGFSERLFDRLVLLTGQQG